MVVVVGVVAEEEEPSQSDGVVSQSTRVEQKEAPWATVTSLTGADRVRPAGITR